MGIPKLNKLLLEKCSPQAIHTVHLETFYKQKVAVDISIYLYRFLGDGNFMEHLYMFLSLFKYYCIEPIFVFDGKPPAEKKDTIYKRKMEERAAKEEYDELQRIEIHDENIQKRIEVLKKKMIRIRWADIDKAIELMDAFGFAHYLAPHEADQLCVHLAKRGDVYAVMSDDMDMIVSGCSRVIRNLNIYTHEAVLYHVDVILSDLHMSLPDFRQIIILSGTDYDIRGGHIPITRAFEMYYQHTGNSFYDWLCEQNIVTDDFMNIYNLFDTDNYAVELDTFIAAAPVIHKKTSVSAIQSIMRPYRFIFI